MVRTPFLALAALLAPSCVITFAELGDATGSRLAEGRTGVRVEYAAYGDYDADYRRYDYPDPAVRESSDFDASGWGVALEHVFLEWFSLVGAFRARDVDDLRGGVAVDDGYTEFSVGGRFYLPVGDPLALFALFDLVVLTGLDTQGAGTLPGAALGVGGAWQVHEDLTLEVVARWVSAVDDDYDDWWLYDERTEVEGTEVVFGLTYWF